MPSLGPLSIVFKATESISTHLSWTVSVRSQDTRRQMKQAKVGVGAAECFGDLQFQFDDV